MSLDQIVHCRKGRNILVALCGSDELTDRIESRRDFKQMQSWELTHAGLRICSRCARLVDEEKTNG